MIIDRDPCDECDAAGFVARIMEYMKAEIMRMLGHRLRDSRSFRAHGTFTIAMPIEYVVLEVELDDPGSHDPGDEDRRIEIGSREFHGAL